MHALFLLLRALLFRGSFTRRSLILYILLSLPAAVIQLWFERIGRPTYGKSPGEIQKSGEDLDAKGLTEYMWDVLYWTYGCIVLAATLGDWAWWAWVVIPAYSAYAAFGAASSVKQSMGALAGQGQPASSESGTSKRQEKIQKRGGKVQYR